MGLIPDAVWNICKTAGDNGLKKAWGMTKSGVAPINNANTIVNGENSIIRRAFSTDRTGDNAKWYDMVMNKGESDEWRLSGGKVAFGLFGASAAGRLLSGGGIYKDADGNTDIIGIPFI